MSEDLSGVSCPKCSKRGAPGATSCARCGLVFARWSGDVAGSATALDPAGEALWAEVTAAFPDEAKHEAFVKHCAAADRLAAAGLRYRGWLDEHPRDPIATRMQGRVVAMATVRLDVARGRTAAAPVTRSRWFWVIITLFMLAGLVAGLLYGRGGPP